MSQSSIIVVGGGLAGLMATIKAAESGMAVKLFSIVPVKRSHSVCAQGGINGAVNTKGKVTLRGNILMTLYTEETFSQTSRRLKRCVKRRLLLSTY